MTEQLRAMLERLTKVAKEASGFIETAFSEGELEQNGYWKLAVDLHAEVHAAEQALLSQPTAGDAGAVVESVLMQHRLLHTFISGTDDGLPLVDRLTPDADFAIENGKEEVAALAEAIVAALPALSQQGKVRPWNWKDSPETRTTPIRCLLCESEAVVVAYAPFGCTCSPNKIQPRCSQHLTRANDTSELLTVIEDFRIPLPTAPKQEG